MATPAPSRGRVTKEKSVGLGRKGEATIEYFLILLRFEAGRERECVCRIFLCFGKKETRMSTFISCELFQKN